MYMNFFYFLLFPYLISIYQVGFCCTFIKLLVLVLSLRKSIVWKKKYVPLTWGVKIGRRSNFFGSSTSKINGFYTVVYIQ